MDVLIDNIITNVCELEGLLLALKRHGDQLPKAALEAMKLKAGEVARMVEDISFPEEPAPVVEEEPAPVVEEEPAPVVEKEPVPVVEEEPVPVVEEEPVPVVEEEPVPVVEEEPAPVVEEESTPVEEVPAVIEEPLRVSEQLHRTISKDLRRALSLNDRFRFSRELFGSDMSKLDNALAAIEGMDTLEQAQTYLFDNYGLNADSKKVAEFMTIVKNHFL